MTTSALQVWDVTVDGGATGDGTTDDTAAIQATLNHAAAVPGSIVVMPPGIYLVSASLTISAAMTVLLEGTILLAPHSNATVVVVAASNVTIRGSGTIDGNQANQTCSGSAPVAGISSTGNPISGMVLQGITVQHCCNWPVNAAQVSNSLMRDCTFLDSANAVQYAGYGDNNWVDHCHIEGISDYGFCFYAGQTHSGIVNSFVKNCLPNIGVLSDAGQTLPCSDILIADNICHQDPSPGGNRCGIFVANNTGEESGTHQNIVIRGNNVRGGNSAPGSYSVLLAGCQVFTCEGNLVHDGQCNVGIKVTGNWGRIAENTVCNQAQGSSGGVGIMIMPGASDNLVADNYVFENDGHNYMVAGIVNNGNATTLINNTSVGV